VTRQRGVPASYLLPLVLFATACSSASGPPQPFGTVLFTNPRSASYFGIAVGRAGFDTALNVDPGTAVCLAFDRARLQGDAAVELYAADQFGIVMGTVFISVASASWTWDGSAPQATQAPHC
jgi:hypothetical protein